METITTKRKRIVAIVGILYLILLLTVIANTYHIGVKNIQPVYVINITVDIFGMFMGFMLFVCCNIDQSKTGTNLRYLFYLINVAYVGLFTDAVAWLVDTKSMYRTINILDNTVYYFCAPVEACFFWFYTVSYLNLTGILVKKLNSAVKIGLMMALFLRVINLFTGIYFVVDEAGVYHRMPYYGISLVYSLATIIAALVVVWVERKRLEKYQVLVFYIYALMPFFIAVLTFMVYGLSISAGVIMLMVLLIYCVLNVAQGREKAVAERDLTLASAIQENVLPRIFPPFPNRKEFDLYASMTPAKEVGGDFYDFFLVDEDHLAIVIADVSGKGIPAALFMMISKALLKNQAMYSKSRDPKKILAKTNEQLCEGNSVELFVTTWIGILTISTGNLVYANAGHEYPAVKRAGGKFEVVKEKHSPPLATMEGLSFRGGETNLKPGDMLFVYTDGVTEATNAEKELFGLDRMLDALNEGEDMDPKSIDNNLRKRIDEFVLDAPQFDDITMLCLKYYGSNM